jgi:hypothetical protein
MKKTALLTVLSVLLLSAILLPSLCQALTVGVQVGDWFKYEGELVSWEADEGVPFPPSQYDTDVLTFNTTDWFKYTVTAINGETVTFEVVTHWQNGTETTATIEDDMANSFTMMIIGTDLGPGDQVRPEYDWTETFGFSWIWGTRTLNASEQDPYAGGTRTANVLDWWMPPIFGDPTTRQIYHWDAATGIQTLYETHSAQTAYDDQFQPIGDYSYVTRRVLVDSSVPGLVVPEVFTTIVMLMILSASTATIVLYRRKKLLV